MQQSMMWASLAGICLASSGVSAADVKPCPYPVEYLSQQLGIKLKVVTQMQGMLGPACEYADDKRSVKISVDAGRNPAPSMDAWLKMSNPPGTKWKAVAGDANKAVLLESYPNGDPYPALSYERNGWLVQINVMGVHGNPATAQWNDKLLKLKRLPD